MSDHGGELELLKAEVASLRIRVDFLELETASNRDRIKDFMALANARATALKNLLALTEGLCMAPYFPQDLRQKIKSHEYIASARAAIELSASDARRLAGDIK